MKIVVKDTNHSLMIPIPTRLIFSRPSIRLYLRLRRSASDGKESISPEAMYALCEEIRRIKRRYGSWELLETESSGGEKVKIIL